jgi:hypothetical protein
MLIGVKPEAGSNRYATKYGEESKRGEEEHPADLCQSLYRQGNRDLDVLGKKMSTRLDEHRSESEADTDH